VPRGPDPKISRFVDNFVSLGIQQRPDDVSQVRGDRGTLLQGYHLRILPARLPRSSQTNATGVQAPNFEAQSRGAQRPLQPTAAALGVAVAILCVLCSGSSCCRSWSHKNVESLFADTCCTIFVPGCSFLPLPVPP
jgi:hypothetical protein